MNNKAISVSLAKIDYDFGKPVIKIIADCPLDYTFDRMDIITYEVDGSDWKRLQFDASGLIADKNDIVFYLPVESLEGVVGPCIYDIYIHATDGFTEEIYDRIYLSDVHGVYRHLLDGMLNQGNCEAMSDDLMQKYLMLYGHQQALQAGDLEIAKELFKLMHKGFSKCGNSGRTETNCGCNVRR